MSSTQKFRKTPKGVLTNMYDHMKRRHQVLFSLKQFHDKYLTDPDYLDLFDGWARSGFNYYKKPSIDRIDPYGLYSFDNIQMITWRENRDKGDTEVSQKKLRPIIQQDLSGRPISRFNSVKEAAASLNISQGLISMVLTGKRTQTHNFKFIYANPELLTK